MVHPIYRVSAFRIVAPYTLYVEFDDGSAHLPLTLDELENVATLYQSAYNLAQLRQRHD